MQKGLTQTLHKSVKLIMRDRSETIDFKGMMLDDGYLMLDIPEFAESEIQQHPVSRNQYPGSRHIGNVFHHSGLIPAKHFMQPKD